MNSNDGFHWAGRGPMLALKNRFRTELLWLLPCQPLHIMYQITYINLKTINIKLLYIVSFDQRIRRSTLIFPILKNKICIRILTISGKTEMFPFVLTVLHLNSILVMKFLSWKRSITQRKNEITKDTEELTRSFQHIKKLQKSLKLK